MSYANPFARYDLWLQEPYMRDVPEYPLVCTNCREHVFEVEDHVEGEAHCYDEDSGEIVGTLKVDYSYEDGPDPDEAYDRMREGDY